ncbi:unnamed protein product [Haemonchus placei]|uniref:Phlebovirus glycoprotein G2 fusion domain-containing protein n=1 Tax=Haemonchus placei TaxID=6290 RepID=A0A0N4WIN7_HAEPC|nr:unnamed protein product [Haemonchus placei]
MLFRIRNKAGGSIIILSRESHGCDIVSSSCQIDGAFSSSYTSNMLCNAPRTCSFMDSSFSRVSISRYDPITLIFREDRETFALRVKNVFSNGSTPSSLNI